MEDTQRGDTDRRRKKGEGGQRGDTDRVEGLHRREGEESESSDLIYHRIAL